MKILIINGWTRHGDDQHLQAKCVLQKNIFKNLVKNYLPNSQVDIHDSYDENKNIDNYDAYMWTGGGGNIYENNSHNYSQLKLCEKIIEIDKPIWGSCWGMQVIVTALGGVIKKCQKPEFGYSKDIKIISSTLNNSIYKGKSNIFDAPAHHYDIVNKLPNEFEIISENEICIQSIYSSSKKIFCTCNQRREKKVTAMNPNILSSLPLFSSKFSGVIDSHEIILNRTTSLKPA